MSLSSTILPPIKEDSISLNPFVVSNHVNFGNKIVSTNKIVSRKNRLRNLIGEEQQSPDTTKIETEIRNKSKESIIDLIQKKKDMFLVQMSLDTKREEIRKLEEKARLKEETLHRSEQMLEEDALRFDAFLKENDKKAHDAIKKAEEEIRKKQEKVQEVKKLTQQIQTLNSDIIKNKESLEECLKYKTFLDDLTPSQWFEDQKLNGGSTISSYFRKPSQLMDIFTSLEEQNLFLIQNSQETEQTLEEVQNSFNKTKNNLEVQSTHLYQVMDDLQFHIHKETQKSENTIKKRFVNPNDQEQINRDEEKLLRSLSSKVEKVYEMCGFDSSSKPTIIFMLSQLESKLESLLIDISHFPQEFVIKSEKEKEKKRREKKREEQQLLLIQQQEDRNKRAIERSMQAPKKRVGKPIMTRSYLIHSGNKKSNRDLTDLKSDEIKFL